MIKNNLVSIFIFTILILLTVITPTNAMIITGYDSNLRCKPEYEQYQNKCVKLCEFGSIRNDNGICEKNLIPQNAETFVMGKDWMCGDKECIELIIKGQYWVCSKGYEQFNNTCLPSCGLWEYRDDKGVCISVEYKEPPEGQYITPTKGVCPMGYINKSGICDSISLPENSSYFDDGDRGWKCNEGFLEEYNECICVPGKKIIDGKCIIKVDPSKERNRSQLIQKIKELLLKRNSILKKN